MECVVLSIHMGVSLVDLFRRFLEENPKARPIPNPHYVSRAGQCSYGAATPLNGFRLPGFGQTFCRVPAPNFRFDRVPQASCLLFSAKKWAFRTCRNVSLSCFANASVSKMPESTLRRNQSWKYTTDPEFLPMVRGQNSKDRSQRESLPKVFGTGMPKFQGAET